MSSGSPYSGKLRVRACGLLLKENKLLLVQLKSPVNDTLIWMPPGGGVLFGETLEEAVVREFLEETGLKVEVGELVFVNEMIQEPFHAIEFYFQVDEQGGTAKLGTDPEHEVAEQLIKELGFFSEQEIQKMNIEPEYLKSGYWAD